MVERFLLLKTFRDWNAVRRLGPPAGSDFDPLLPLFIKPSVKIDARVWVEKDRFKSLLWHISCKYARATFLVRDGVTRKV